jgi:hypothetical protein
VLRFNQGALWVQLGGECLTGCKQEVVSNNHQCLALEKVFEKEENLRERGSSRLFLINHYMWDQSVRARFIWINFIPLYFFPLTKGAHRDRKYVSSPLMHTSAADSDFEQKGIENGKRGQTVMKIYK